MSEGVATRVKDLLDRFRYGRARTLLSSYIDGELSERERRRVERHLSGCAECRAELESLRLTVELVRGLPEVEPSRSFTLSSAPEAERGGFGWIANTRMAAVVAAVLLVAILAGLAGLLRVNPQVERADMELAPAVAPAVAPMPAAPAAAAPAPIAAQRSAPVAPVGEDQVESAVKAIQTEPQAMTLDAAEATSPPTATVIPRATLTRSTTHERTSIRAGEDASPPLIPVGVGAGIGALLLALAAWWVWRRVVHRI